MWWAQCRGMSLSGLGDRNKLAGISELSEDRVRSRCDMTSPVWGGLGERDDVARPFPLELIRGGERERLRTMDARDRTPRWTVGSSAAAALSADGLVGLRVSSSSGIVRGGGLRSRRRTLSRPGGIRVGARSPGTR
jgi:hypothetical protein